MKSHVRAAVAAIALCHATKRKVSSIYDYSRSSHVNIDANVTGTQVNGYDYQNGCHIDGTIPSLYHYGVSSYIDFQPSSPGHYEGYDYNTSSHFEVTVNGSDVEVYDYGESSFFSYSA